MSDIRELQASLNADVVPSPPQPGLREKVLGGIFAFLVLVGGWQTLGWIGGIVLSRSNTASYDGGSARPSALDQMTIAFQGGYSRDQIKYLLDEVMSMHRVKPEENSYRQWGSVLVEMRKTTPGTSEMEILRCMRRMGVSMTFPENSAFCAVFISNGMQ